MTKNSRSKRIKLEAMRSVIKNVKNGQEPKAMDELSSRASVVKQHVVEADFTRKYEYIAKDLRHILLIAVPMLFGIILLSFFLK